MSTLKSTTNQEIVHEGWLIKSPPTNHFWHARWRQRWFMLRHSGELPGQFMLEYYTDETCKKLKGRIDLDQCEQVDAGLKFTNRKQKYKYMFNLKTPKRTYYLVAQNENDMNKWVDAVCQVCGLKAQEEDAQSRLFTFDAQDSPPISPASTVSGPYIPISECITGRSLFEIHSLNSHDQGGEHYDAPRKLAPSPPRSPTTTDADSVFTDDESSTPIPNVNWETFPSPNEPKGENKSMANISEADANSWSAQKRFGKMKIRETSNTPPPEEVVVPTAPAPPRPPKPSHMFLNNPGHNYLNLDGATESTKPITPLASAPSTPATAIVTDETYDFPRSHQPEAIDPTNTLGRRTRHCYTNAAPTNVTDDGHRVFRYDFHDDEPSSPRSESSVTATYSNLPSPLSRAETVSTLIATPSPTTTPTSSGPTPPVVYRQLKPGRKTSDTRSLISNEPSPDFEPPSINRKLKPPNHKSSHDIGPLQSLQLANPPGRGKSRMNRSPTLQNAHSNRHLSASDDDNTVYEQDKEEIYYFQNHNTFIPASSSRKFNDLQYLDLDLDKPDNFNNAISPVSPPSSTVYKTVDFLKTEAFNRTRQKVEEERKQCADGLT
ncbi:hypothetical protein TKK_0002829 [Trichogramma kaykai]|uniref:PH domain-containing protein n=1 Tax=Trichogramma kaykai TaxID=54128 RepID=A0ABD2XUP2_9HYME